MSGKKTKNMEAMALKMLRQERQDYISRARENIKKQNHVIKAIRKALSGDARTIPELSTEIEMETETVLMYISTLKKYGMVAEGIKDGDYFKYELIS